MVNFALLKFYYINEICEITREYINRILIQASGLDVSWFSSCILTTVAIFCFIMTGFAPLVLLFISIYWLVMCQGFGA